MTPFPKNRKKIRDILGRRACIKSSFPYFSLHKESILPEPFLKVRMDATNTCNLKCRMCYFSLPGHKTIDGSPLRHMPLKLLEKIASQVFPHARFLSLACGAESLMYPHFKRYLELVASARIETTELITNGQLLDEGISEALIQSRLSILCISIDGATSETYEYIRKGARFDKLLENIRALNRLKNSMDSEYPSLLIQYVLMRSNIEELTSAVNLAKELGARGLNCVHMAPIAGLGMSGESLFHHKELTNAKMDEARETAERVGLTFTAPPNFGTPPGDAPTAGSTINCPNDPWHHLFITESGIAYPCGWLTKETVAGRFESQDFREIWFGKEYERLRWEIKTGNYRPQCKKCPAAAGGSVDEEIAFSER